MIYSSFGTGLGNLIGMALFFLSIVFVLITVINIIYEIEQCSNGREYSVKVPIALVLLSIIILFATVDTYPRNKNNKTNYQLVSKSEIDIVKRPNGFVIFEENGDSRTVTDYQTGKYLETNIGKISLYKYSYDNTLIPIKFGHIVLLDTIVRSNPNAL